VPTIPNADQEIHRPANFHQNYAWNKAVEVAKKEVVMAESSSRKTGRKSGDGFALTQSPGHQLRRVQQYLFDLYSQEIRGEDLTPRQFTVLLTVEQNEGLSQTDLVRLTGIDRSTLADMISRLLKRDLLARKRTEDDQRANSVRITASGRRVLKSVMPAVMKAEARILDPIPAGKRAEFLRLLAMIADAASVEEEKPPKKKPAARARATRRAGRVPMRKAS
jgi:DNA-binding MarR family transcriptional regulator